MQTISKDIQVLFKLGYEIFCESNTIIFSDSQVCCDASRRSLKGYVASLASTLHQIVMMKFDSKPQQFVPLFWQFAVFLPYFIFVLYTATSNFSIKYYAKNVSFSKSEKSLYSKSLIFSTTSCNLRELLLKYLLFINQ